MKEKIYFDDRKIGVPENKGIVTHYYSELMYVIYIKPSCRLFFSNNKRYWVNISIQSLKEHLPDEAFMMCKRSVIANLCYLKNFVSNPPTIEMTDGVTFKLSKKNAQDFELILDNSPAISPPCPICYPCKEKCERQTLLCKKQNDD